MEAIINRASAKLAEPALAGWLLETRKVGRTLLRRIGHVLVHYSRAAMLLRGGDRPFRRL